MTHINVRQGGFRNGPAQGGTGVKVVYDDVDFKGTVTGIGGAGAGATGGVREGGGADEKTIIFEDFLNAGNYDDPNRIVIGQHDFAVVTQGTGTAPPVVPDDNGFQNHPGIVRINSGGDDNDIVAVGHGRDTGFSFGQRLGAGDELEEWESASALSSVITDQREYIGWSQAGALQPDVRTYTNGWGFIYDTSFDANNWYFVVRDGGATVLDQVVASAIANNWYVFRVTTNPNGIITAFLDGQQVAQASHSQIGSVATGGGWFHILQQLAGSGPQSRVFSLDYVKLVLRAFTTEERTTP